MSDALFDLADFEPAPVYSGRAPLTFTTEYYTPDELILAGQFADRGRHAWHAAVTLFVLNADLRCKCWLNFSATERAQGYGCQCIGDLIYQANCVECRWHHIGDEREVVEVWHDHAWPGWRVLPIVPRDVCPFGGGMSSSAIDRKAAARARAWVAEHYPREWQVEGAPVRTERAPMGTRNVPGYSPWGGFDICAAVTTETVTA